jgi:hypothetical protein
MRGILRDEMNFDNLIHLYVLQKQRVLSDQDASPGRGHVLNHKQVGWGPGKVKFCSVGPWRGLSDFGPSVRSTVMEVIPLHGLRA